MCKWIYLDTVIYTLWNDGIFCHSVFHCKHYEWFIITGGYKPFKFLYGYEILQSCALGVIWVSNHIMSTQLKSPYLFSSLLCKRFSAV